MIGAAIAITVFLWWQLGSSSEYRGEIEINPVIESMTGYEKDED